MKQIKHMSQVQLAAYIQSYLEKEGIKVVLSGGSAVSFYSDNKYVSNDLDLINTNLANRKDIKAAMERIGFQEKGRYFISPQTEFLIEFPQGPLSVGEEPVKVVDEFELATGTLSIISATDCVKDRLCAIIFGTTNKGWHRLFLFVKAKRWTYVKFSVGQRWKGKKNSFSSLSANWVDS